jgi:hypothetical protein
MDVSDKLGKNGGYIGMVTSALWTDLNGDRWPDLIIVGEYMPITIMINENNRFINRTEDYHLENTSGWWNSISGADIDHDGDIDYAVGNFGLNSFFKPTVKHPVEIYGNDYDKNGSFDPITTVYTQDQSYILHPRNLMIDQIPSFEYRFRTFDQYSTTAFNRSFTPEEISSSLHLQCNMLQSVVLESNDDQSFLIHPLPNEAQFSPIYGIAFEDFNQDQLPDLFLVGNSYAEETVYGYYDASFGSVLLNQGDLSWKFVQNNQINLIADGDKKALSKLRIGDRTGYILSENNGYLQALSLNHPLPGSILELEEDDWYALIDYDNGEKSKIEFYHGAGYLSQDSRILIKEPHIKGIKIMKYSGKLRNF